MSCFRPLYVTYNHGQFGKFGGRLTQSVLNDYSDSETEVVPVPCGRCVGCRLDRAQAWSDRMLLEFNISRDDYPAKTALFLTLTYEDSKRSMVFCSDNVYRGNLVVRDYQLFLKRLRKSLSHKIRYFVAGEYGSTTFRPHYHMIIFGLSLSDFPDSLIYSQDSDGSNVLYFSPLLDKLWSKGSVKFSPASYGTFCYVAQYVIKKQYLSDNDGFDFYLGRKPPFIAMSRRPGIGSDYFSSDCIDDSQLVPSVSVNDGDDVHIVKIPRSYLNKLSLTNPELYDIIMSNRRALASSADLLVKERIGDNYFDFLKASERSLFSHRLSLGKRDKI